MKNLFKSALLGLAIAQAGLAHAADAVPPEVDWGGLQDILEAVPAPPTLVHDAVGYGRGLGPRIERLEARLNRYEERLDYLTDQAASAAVQRELRLAAEQLEAARRRYMATPGTAGDDHETARERQTPRGTAPPVSVAAVNSAVGRFAFQISGRAIAEERAVENFTGDWRKRDDACVDDEPCVRREETNHWGNVARYKNAQYPAVKAEWQALAARVYSLSDGIGRHSARAGSPARSRMDIERLASLQPLRTLLLATGTLFSESRKRWEEADNIQTLLTQFTPGH